MKLHYFAALLLGFSLTAGAQGYKDGIEYYKAGQYRNAITVLDRNLGNADTDKALANYYLGQSYMAMNDNAKAKACFDAGISANSNCAYNYVGLGALDLLTGNKSGAEDNFKTAQKLAKKNTEVLVDIARAYFNADATLYAKEIEKYINKARKDSKNQDPSIYIFEGDRKARNKDFNSAATEYEQAIYFDKDNPEGYVKYANVYFYTSPDYAIKRLEELLALQPNSALAQRELAEKFYQNDQWSRAAEQYGKYIENPNHFPEDKARYAVLLYAGGEYGKALDVANDVLKSSPEDITLQRIVIRSLNELDRKPEALQAMQAYFNNPANVESFNVSDYSTYAQLLSDNGQDSIAVIQIEKGVQKFPKEARLLSDLSNIYYSAKDYPAAADAYQKYIEATENPSSNDLFTGSTRSLQAAIAMKADDTSRQKFVNQGLAYVDRMMDPENPRPSYLWRKAVLQLNRNLTVDDEVASTFEQLVKVLDTNPAYSDPTNKSNYLDEYVAVYQSLIPYYERKENQAAADNAKAMLEKYKTIRDGAGAQ